MKTGALRGAGFALVCALASCARPAWERPPPPVQDRPVVAEAHLTRAQLDNGLRVLFLEDRRLPRVVLGVTLRRGESGVAPDHAGLVPFTAELMRRGAGERDALELARAVDELGASLGAGSGWDSTGVTVSGLSRDFDRLVEILADVVLRPRFDPEEAERTRGEILAGLERAVDSPETLAGWNTARALYPGHRFGLPLSGTPETVARLDAAAARAHHQRFFAPDNAIFAASGDVSPERLVRAVRGSFGGWQAARVPGPGDPPPHPTPPERRIVIVDRPDLGQAQIVVAHEGIARTDPERVAGGLMNAVLGGSGFSSRLMAKVRAEEGLAYGVYSGFSLRRSPGPFRVATSTRVGEARRVIDLLLSELDRMRREPPAGRELEDARTLTLGRFSLGLETSDAVMDALVDLEVHGLPEDSLDTYRRRVRGVGADDVARMARALLHPERAAIVLVGPAEALRPQVEDLGPVEVVRPE